MMEERAGQAGLVPFGEKLAASHSFSALFRAGMALVEETAAYLDGPGRKESKQLSRAGALSYATESMRLTTRLMQLASWLLLHRAVNEGEMSLAQANNEKTKVRLCDAAVANDEVMGLLPEQLVDLIQRTAKLQLDVRRLDATIHASVSEPASSGNPLDHHLGLLKAAFERGER